MPGIHFDAVRVDLYGRLKVLVDKEIASLFQEVLYITLRTSAAAAAALGGGGTSCHRWSNLFFPLLLRLVDLSAPFCFRIRILLQFEMNQLVFYLYTLFSRYSIDKGCLLYTSDAADE